MSISRIETILSGGEVMPQSRIEKILVGEDVIPQSRIETLLKEKLGGGGGGGTEITNGIVFNTVNSQGRPTEVSYYGQILPHAMFGASSSESWSPFGFRTVTKVNLVGTTTLAPAFQKSSVEEITGTENVTNINYPTGDGQCFASAVSLKHISLPKVSNIPNHTFNTCTALTSAEIGSVNNPVTNVSTSSFSGCTQSGLTITVYTTSAYKDTALANIRNKATNATIIIKDATTGETLVTSTP